MVQLSDNYQILQVVSALLSKEELASDEAALLQGVSPCDPRVVDEVLGSMRRGDDPLGEAYMQANPPDGRRAYGEVYTPSTLIESMVASAKRMGTPARVVDPGCGSGRFAIACARAFPHAHIVAVDSSPMATLMCKAAVRGLGLDDRMSVVLGDFMTVPLPDQNDGPTLWIGNPPYVRHHDIPGESKKWLTEKAREIGVKASGLSGLHAYFLLSIALRIRENDFGVLVTSAEWLDVNYGALMRKLLINSLGLCALELYDRNERMFKRADTTALVFSFAPSNAKLEDASVFVSHACPDASARYIKQSLFSESDRWSELIAETGKSAPPGYVRLGDIARVHRGIVTGANKFWVRDPGDEENVEISIPVVSHARELMTGSPSLEIDALARLIVLPQDLDSLEGSNADRAKSLIEEGKRRGVDRGYVARARKCWWSIPVGEGATILMTYMARRPPVFVANPERVRSLNVAHGIYPFVELSERAVHSLVDYLNSSVSQAAGRTYCGGLTKFEPREVEALWVPSPAMLEEDSWRS